MFAIDILRMGKKKVRGSITYKGGVLGVFTAASGIDLATHIPNLAAGDVLVMAMAQPNTNADNAPPTLTGNVTGQFAAAAFDLYANDSSDVNLHGWVQRVTGTDTSIAISPSGGTFAIYCFSGVDPDTPLDVAIQTNTGTNSDIANPPAITPVTNGAFIVCFYSGNQGGNNVAWSAPTANPMDAWSVTGAGVKIAIGRKLWTGGTFDPGPIISAANDVADSNAAATIALRPGWV
jgi:hypothetical protein